MKVESRPGRIISIFAIKKDRLCSLAKVKAYGRQDSSSLCSVRFLLCLLMNEGGHEQMQQNAYFVFCSTSKLLFLVLKDLLEDYSNSLWCYYYKFTSYAGLGKSHNSASVASSAKITLIELLEALNQLIDIKGLEEYLMYGYLVRSTIFHDSYHKLHVFNYFGLTSATWGRSIPTLGLFLSYLPRRNS